MPGRIHYSFKGPALTGQSIETPGSTLPATAGMVDIDFPCRFTERPTFTYGYEHAENAEADSLVPMVASVVSWKTGRRAETGLPFYDGARVLITAPSVAAATATSTGGAGIVTGILCLNNSTGSRNGSNYLEWDSAYAVGDRTWFQFPYGGDESQVSIQRPGIAVVTLTYQSGSSVDVTLNELKTGVQALASEDTDTIGIAVPYYTNNGFFDVDLALIRAEALGNFGNPVYSALSIVFYDDFAWSAVPGSNWEFSTTEGW